MKKLLALCVIGASFLTAHAAHNIDNYNEVLTVKVTDIKTVSTAQCGDGRGYTMLSFSGSCDNEYFKGTVLPGALDTQTSEDGIVKFSARYVLEGTDFEGNDCRIYIENNAKAGSPYSKPEVFTDSKALSFLNDSDLVGYLDNEGDFTVRIYAHADKQAE